MRVTSKRPLAIAFVLVLLLAGGCRAATPTSGEVGGTPTSLTNGSTLTPGGSTGSTGGNGGSGTTTPPVGRENSEP
jgi:hypothetical protein